MKIVNHKLTGENVSFKQTPNVGKNFPKGLPDTIVIHYTAAPSASSAINWLTNKNAGASAHLVVARDGKITQLADFNVITWHAGKSKWKDREGLNNYSIGIEIDNCGILQKIDSKTYQYGETGPKFSKDEIILAVHRNGGKTEAWHKYTDIQIEKVKEICKLLIGEYDIKFILGHEEIAPGRKTDPGPAFPLDELREELLGNQKKQKVNNFPLKGITVKDTPLLSTPEENAELVYKKVSTNTELNVLEEKNSFFKVEVPIIGYVAKAHVQLDNTDSNFDGIIATDGLNFRSKPDAKSEILGKPLSKGQRFHLLENGAAWILIRYSAQGWVKKESIRFL